MPNHSPPDDSQGGIQIGDVIGDIFLQVKDDSIADSGTQENTMKFTFIQN